MDGAYRQAVGNHIDRIRTGQTIIVAADTLPMQMAILRDGLSHGQVGQRPFEMGYRSMYVLRDLAEGVDVEDPIYTGLDVCLPATAESCLSQD